MKSIGPTLAVAVLLSLASACTETVFTEPEVLGGEEVDPDVLNSGRELYIRNCMNCHGMEGDGMGPSADGYWPPPRDFRDGVFKFAGVTDEFLPDDDELIRIVRQGLTGTAMVPWDVPEDELWLIIQYIKTFSSPEGVNEETGKKIRAKGFRKPRKKTKAPEIPTDPFMVIPRLARWDDAVMDEYIAELRDKGQSIPTDENGLKDWKREKRAEAEAKRQEAVAFGAEVYHAGGCQLCHPAFVPSEQIVKWGGTPRATDPFESDAKWSDTYRVTLLPPDFTRHPVRSPKQYWTKDRELRYDARDFYRVIASGIPGTAMPSWAALPPERVWAVAYYVADLAEKKDSKEAREMRDALLALPPWKPAPPPPPPAPAEPAEGADAAEAGEGGEGSAAPTEAKPVEEAAGAAPAATQ